MNVKEYASLEFLKFKYRRGEDKVIQSLCRIGPPHPPPDIRSPLFSL